MNTTTTRRPVPEVHLGTHRTVHGRHEDTTGAVEVTAYGGRGSAYLVKVNTVRLGGPDQPWTVNGYDHGTLYKDTSYPSSQEWRWAPTDARHQTYVTGSPKGYPTLGVAVDRIAAAVLRVAVADAAKAGA